MRAGSLIMRTGGVLFMCLCAMALKEEKPVAINKGGNLKLGYLWCQCFRVCNKRQCWHTKNLNNYFYENFSLPPQGNGKSTDGMWGWLRDREREKERCAQIPVSFEELLRVSYSSYSFSRSFSFLVHFLSASTWFDVQKMIEKNNEISSVHYLKEKPHQTEDAHPNACNPFNWFSI